MIEIIGGGRMGTALVGGLVASGQDVTVVEARPERREELTSDGRFAVSDAPVAAEGAIIAVKPKDAELATSDAAAAGARRILSIVSGVTVVKLHEWAGSGVPVMRAMPNIGAIAQLSATALTPGPGAHDEDLAWAESVLGTVGTVVRVSEDLIDAVTGLSGSGPAYLFLVAEAMIEGGVAAGLSHEAARELMVQTMAGAAALLGGSDRSPAQWRADVTTPAGTTAAALQALEQRATRAAFVEAVLAAARRSHDLGAPAAR